MVRPPKLRRPLILALGAKVTMDTFILTGPIGVGKSTQAKLLSSELGMPVCVYDEVKDNYRYKIGLDREKAHAINAKEGIYAMLCYMNEFKAKILTPIIDDHPGHIIDLGADRRLHSKSCCSIRLEQVIDPACRP